MFMSSVAASLAANAALNVRDDLIPRRDVAPPGRAVNNNGDNGGNGAQNDTINDNINEPPHNIWVPDNEDPQQQQSLPSPTFLKFPPPPTLYLLCSLTLLISSLLPLLLSPVPSPLSTLKTSKFFQASIMNFIGYLTLSLKPTYFKSICGGSKFFESRESYESLTSYLIFKFIIISQHRGEGSLCYPFFFGILGGLKIAGEVLREVIGRVKDSGREPGGVRVERGWTGIAAVGFCMLAVAGGGGLRGLKLRHLIMFEILIVLVETAEAVISGTVLRVTWGFRERVQAIEAHMEQVGGTQEGRERWQDEIDEINEKILLKSKEGDEFIRYMRMIKSSSLFFSYLHLWISIGFDYSFFDGLLVLSVRSCVYEFCETALEWARECEIGKEMEESFEKPTGEELTNLKDTSEVCCICLKPFGCRGSNVRKIHCGHFFHMTCLSEILKRAGGIRKARCPICRQPVFPQKKNEFESNEGDSANQQQPQSQAQAQAPESQAQSQSQSQPQTQTPTPTPTPTPQTQLQTPPAQVQNQNPPPQPAQPPLFRFSTESFPTWFPQFSFEVVQRPQPQRLLPRNDQVNFVSDMFPGVERQRIEGMLNGRNADEVVNILLEE
ncbi:hypothetical protein TrVE_jg150 [Triparma verrucosa]|uniref:RING-type domain-containing protein n=1 Tax=Triparma verrucosa TaxID=1606542 RepID=A0A9W7FQ25_9STRA|nr:hypothetical protein TrVE_jg150 [Triparma verrucosa]